MREDDMVILVFWYSSYYCFYILVYLMLIELLVRFLRVGIANYY